VINAALIRQSLMDTGIQDACAAAGDVLRKLGDCRKKRVIEAATEKLGDEVAALAVAVRIYQARRWWRRRLRPRR